MERTHLAACIEGQRACIFNLSLDQINLVLFSCDGASDAPQLAARVRRRNLTETIIGTGAALISIPLFFGGLIGFFTGIITALDGDPSGIIIAIFSLVAFGISKILADFSQEMMQ